MSGPEAGLVRRCLAGDEKAYRELVEMYQAQVYSLALRMVRRPADAEDLTQETFVRMFRALSRYDPTRSFAAWLMTIATRLSIDHIRRRKVSPISLTQRERDTEEEYEIEVQDPGLKPDEVATHAEEERRVVGMIDALPPHYRIVVILRHQQDLSYEEIAEALQMPLGTVKARIHRARALLKARIEGEPK
ncbi:MAG: sigma-70 family RNA polymerase sigma factor [Candidatus Eisenbacteria bacterium]|uniref:Sigma-70 family RNA polymerase sigma factor n=1 Tax=Eiseniibacteriota bacterium TaxID=2212470 RepID=A0A9D6L5A4_UNCEI|nr:sigma-70 family RNA polymerase sigma factor [Candidatus Eisenbacteria bacterium]MBI3540102.1 sigma-70 family RNA polymerase sigma factor [Candidatus Eisenbacteria bacterium]